MSDARLAAIEARLRLITWLVGVNIALTLGTLVQTVRLLMILERLP